MYVCASEHLTANSNNEQWANINSNNGDGSGGGDGGGNMCVCEALAPGIRRMKLHVSYMSNKSDLTVH